MNTSGKLMFRVTNKYVGFRRYLSNSYINHAVESEMLCGTYQCASEFLAFS